MSMGPLGSTKIEPSTLNTWLKMLTALLGPLPLEEGILDPEQQSANGLHNGEVSHSTCELGLYGRL